MVEIEFVKKHYMKLIVAVLLVIPLFFLTSVVLYFQTLSGRVVKVGPKRLPPQEFEPVTTAGLCSIDSVVQSDNLTKTVTVTGWALLPNSAENNGKTIQLVLESAEGGYSYQMDSNILDRWDVWATFEGKYYRHVPVVGIHHGFEAAFSPLKVRDGFYFLNFYVTENEDVQGYIATGWLYEKDRLSFHASNRAALIEKIGYASPISNLNFGQATVSDKLRYSLDEITLMEEYLYIRGWAFVDGYLASITNTYLSITPGNGQTIVYMADKERREDIGTYYDNELYADSGFHLYIPRDSISIDSDNLLQIYIGTEFTQEPYSFNPGF